MFEVYCPGHRSHVLLTISRIEALRNTPDGPVADWRCWCGTRGHLLGGSRADARGGARVIDLLAARPAASSPDRPARKVG